MDDDPHERAAARHPRRSLHLPGGGHSLHHTRDGQPLRHDDSARAGSRNASRHRQHCRTGADRLMTSSGMTLLEVLVAPALLAVIGAALARSVAGVATAGRIFDLTRTSHRLAEHTLEIAIAGHTDDPTPPARPWAVQLRFTPRGPHLSHVTVEVRHDRLPQLRTSLHAIVWRPSRRVSRREARRSWKPWSPSRSSPTFPPRLSFGFAPSSPQNVRSSAQRQSIVPCGSWQIL